MPRAEFVRYFHFDPAYTGGSSNAMIYYWPGSADPEEREAIAGTIWADSDGEPLRAGFYWIAGLPGCLFDSDPTGPFPSADDALADAQYPV